jgi:hypothetical protein
MKKMILKLIFFFSGLLLISLLFNSIIYDNYTDLYEAVDLNFDTYLLADSHGLPLADNLEKYGVYNFSAASDSYHDMYRKIRYLIQKSNVNRIILTAGDHTLSPYRDDYNNLDRSICFATLDEFDNKFDFIKTRFIFNNIPVFKPKARDIVKFKLKSTLFNTSDESICSNWSQLSVKEKKSRCLSRSKAQFRYEEKSKQLANKLEDIFLLCDQNNIEIIGIKLPLSKVYLELLGEKNFKADSLFLKHNLIIWDFKKTLIDKPEYFQNQDHLNETGGEKFSKLLKIFICL